MTDPLNNPEESEMTAIPYEDREEGLDSFDDDYGAELPPRPRRQWLTPWTALLFALLLAGAGFYAGVRVEKSQVSNNSGNVLSALASRLGGAGRTGGGGGGGGGGFLSRLASGDGLAAAGGGALAGAAGGSGLAAAFAGGGASVGTVSSIDGNTLYVTETSGNTVKVTLSSATSVTKNQPVHASVVRPGDSVIVVGVKDSSGTVSATSVTDSGNRAGGSGQTSSTPTNGTSAVNSLFGGG
jgi:hypothetical protein